MTTAKKNLKLADEMEETVAAVPESLAIAQRGIRTANDLAGLMDALLRDLITGTISAEVGVAIGNAAGTLVEAVALQYDYAAANNTTGRKNLILITAEANPSSET